MSPRVSAALVLLMTALYMQDLVLAADKQTCSSKNCASTFTCPAGCPKFNDPKAKFECSINCHKCQVTCKKNACWKRGAVCTDPRFVGGDGIFFYFHGKANEDFCIVSDDNLHINAHFIGKRPLGRTRDFTWVQALGILYASHKVSVSAKKVALWDNLEDQLELFYDGMRITLATEKGESWTSPSGEFKVMRMEEVNAVEIEVTRLLKVSMQVKPVSEEDSNVHNYGVSGANCFAHLDLHFSFFNVSAQVGGVLGQTYRTDYKSRVKVGVPMPIMGGYDTFKTSSLFAPDCKVARFLPKYDAHQLMMPSMSCTSGSGENGILCRR